ncbi:VanZ family protein [Gemmiger formicilis]
MTGRGMADVNDVLFNTLGAAVGVWLARRIA